MRTIQDRGLIWWVIVGALILWGLFYLLGCSEPSGPTVEMRRVPSEAEFSANMKANGIAFHQGGVCNPGPSGTVAKVQICFANLLQAMAVTGGAATTCIASIGGAANPVGAVRAGSVCTLGLLTSGAAIALWFRSTEIDLWANQSAEEISNRMRQAIYERMVREGRWSENAGCC